MSSNPFIHKTVLRYELTGPGDAFPWIKCFFSDHLLYFCFSRPKPLSLLALGSVLGRGSPIFSPEASAEFMDRKQCLLPPSPGSERVMITDACTEVTGEIWVKSTDKSFLVLIIILCHVIKFLIVTEPRLNGLGVKELLCLQESLKWFRGNK